MKKETTLTNISLTERQHDSYRDVKGGEFFVSSDKLNWTAVGAFEAQKVLEEQIFSVTPTKGRYFKIKIRKNSDKVFCIYPKNSGAGAFKVKL